MDGLTYQDDLENDRKEDQPRGNHQLKGSGQCQGSDHTFPHPESSPGAVRFWISGPQARDSEVELLEREASIHGTPNFDPHLNVIAEHAC